MVVVVDSGVAHLIKLSVEAIIIGVAVFASKEDIKNHEISIEPLLLGLIASLTYALIFDKATITSNVLPTVGIALLLSLTGVWALGDLLVITMMSPFLPPLYFYVNLLIPLIPLIMVYVIYQAKVQGITKQYFQEVFIKLKTRGVSTFVFLLILGTWMSALSVKGYFWSLMITIGVAIGIQAANKYLGAMWGKIVVGSLLLAGLILSYNANPVMMIKTVVLSTLFVVILYIPYVMASTASFAFEEKKKVEELKEGDILKELIYREGGVVKKAKLSGMALFYVPFLIQMKENVEIIIKPNSNGLTDEQIEILKELVESGELENEFTLTKSVPLVPAILVAFIITITYPQTIFNWLALLTGWIMHH
jgi:hypothetical protein